MNNEVNKEAGFKTSELTANKIYQKVSVKKRILELMECDAFHYVIIMLILLDLVIVMIQQVLELHHLEGYLHDEKSLAFGHEFLFILSLTILTVLLLEIVVKISLMRWDYLKDILCILDAIVILFSLPFEIYLHLFHDAIGQIAAPTIILFRFWKVIRGVHAIAHSVEVKNQVIIQRIEKEKEIALSRINNYQSMIYDLSEQIIEKENKAQEAINEVEKYQSNIRRLTRKFCTLRNSFSIESLGFLEDSKVHRRSRVSKRFSKPKGIRKDYSSESSVETLNLAQLVESDPSSNSRKDAFNSDEDSSKSENHMTLRTASTEALSQRLNSLDSSESTRKLRRLRGSFSLSSEATNDVIKSIPEDDDLESNANTPKATQNNTFKLSKEENDDLSKSGGAFINPNSKAKKDIMRIRYLSQGLNENINLNAHASKVNETNKVRRSCPPEAELEYPNKIKSPSVESKNLEFRLTPSTQMIRELICDASVPSSENIVISKDTNGPNGNSLQERKPLKTIEKDLKGSDSTVNAIPNIVIDEVKTQNDNPCLTIKSPEQQRDLNIKDENLDQLQLLVKETVLDTIDSPIIKNSEKKEVTISSDNQSSQLMLKEIQQSEKSDIRDNHKLEVPVATKTKTKKPKKREYKPVIVNTNDMISSGVSSYDSDASTHTDLAPALSGKLTSKVLLRKELSKRVVQNAYNNTTRNNKVEPTILSKELKKPHTPAINHQNNSKFIVNPNKPPNPQLMPVKLKGKKPQFQKAWSTKKEIVCLELSESTSGISLIKEDSINENSEFIEASNEDIRRTMVRGYSNRPFVGFDVIEEEREQEDEGFDFQGKLNHSTSNSTSLHKNMMSASTCSSNRTNRSKTERSSTAPALESSGISSDPRYQPFHDFSPPPEFVARNLSQRPSLVSIYSKRSSKKGSPKRRK